MKIFLKLKRLKGNKIPFAYNYYLASFIYDVIKKSDSHYAEILHDKGYILQGKSFKLFTFSQLQIKQVKFHTNNLFIQDKEAGLYLSSPVDEWIQHFINGVFALPVFFIGKVEFCLTDVQILPEPDFKQDLNVKTLSPITVSTAIQKDQKLIPRYLDYREPLFKQNIKKNLVNKCSAIKRPPPEENDFDFIFDEEYIRRKGNISKLLQYKGISIRGYTAPLTLTGSPEMKRMAYYAGLGDRNSNGFGCLL